MDDDKRTQSGVCRRRPKDIDISHSLSSHLTVIR